MNFPILLPNIFNHPFTYKSDLKLSIGDFVEVPFGKAKIIGVVWDNFEKNSYKTPFGEHIVAEKIGENLPFGAVLKGRKWTQEVIEPIREQIDIPEDVITSRILWLDGLEEGINKGGEVDSKERFIYIHGTAEEGLIGKPASIGCIRMKNKDVIKLFNRVKENTKVLIYSNKTQYF